MARTSFTLLLTLLDDLYFLPEWVTCARRLRPDEIVVVDGGSQDGGPQYLLRQNLPNLRLIHRSMEEIDWHYSNQLNFAVEHTNTDWILLVDADEVLWPPKRRVIERALRRAQAGVVSLWFARFHLWPDDRTRLDWGPNLDPQPRLWNKSSGIRWVRKVHNLQRMNGSILTWNHPRSQLLAKPFLLHRKLTAPRPVRLARHRRWRDHWAEASAAAGFPVPAKMPKSFGPTAPLPRDVADWHRRLMGGPARFAPGGWR